MHPKRILVGVDFSDESQHAIAQAMHIARRYGSHVTLVHAADLSGAQYLAAGIGSEDMMSLVPEAMSAAHRRLGEERERHKGQGVEISVVLSDSNPVHALERGAEELSADLIVVGSRGNTGAKRVLLGSVAERITRVAPCDVLVSRSDSGAGGFKKLLVPTDFSDLAALAVPVAQDLVAEDGSIDLYHAVQIPAVAGLYFSDGVATSSPLLQDLEKEGKKRLDEFSGGLSGKVKLGTRCSISSPSYGIEKLVESEGYDAVVIASHGRSGFKRLLLGSVAESVIRHSPCSVFVHRRHELRK